MDLVLVSFTKPIFILAYITSFFPKKGKKVNIRLHSGTGFTKMVLKATDFQYNLEYYFLSTF